MWLRMKLKTIASIAVCLLIFAAACYAFAFGGLIFCCDSGLFGWGSGEVKLPSGFTYKAERGMDSFIGKFTSQDGKLVVRHDIGELAGEHGGTGGTETLTEGSRVRTGQAVVDGNPEDGK